MNGARRLVEAKADIDFGAEADALVPAAADAVTVNFAGNPAQVLKALGKAAKKKKVSEAIIDEVHTSMELTPTEKAAVEAATFDSFTPKREYTPAIRLKDGTVKEGISHFEIAKQINPGATSSQSAGQHGFTTRDGQFLTIMEVARREMAKKTQPAVRSEAARRAVDMILSEEEDEDEYLARGGCDHEWHLFDRSPHMGRDDDWYYACNKCGKRRDDSRQEAEEEKDEKWEPVKPGLHHAGHKPERKPNPRDDARTCQHCGGQVQNSRCRRCGKVARSGAA